MSEFISMDFKVKRKELIEHRGEVTPQVHQYNTSDKKVFVRCALYSLFTEFLLFCRN